MKRPVTWLCYECRRVGTAWVSEKDDITSSVDLDHGSTSPDCDASPQIDDRITSPQTAAALAR